ncbi:hypothetical protein B0H13DRAFT_1903643 [Mycena leptocephala]|nr:hypothetical protein B0H13DRAFT_1903643 [Mycena leptocephala]
MFSKISVIVTSVLIVRIQLSTCFHLTDLHFISDLAAACLGHSPVTRPLPQCCNSVVSSSSAAASGVAALLGLDLTGLNVPVGLSCSPSPSWEQLRIHLCHCDAPTGVGGLIAINCILSLLSADESCADSDLFLICTFYVRSRFVLIAANIILFFCSPLLQLRNKFCSGELVFKTVYSSVMRKHGATVACFGMSSVSTQTETLGGRVFTKDEAPRWPKNVGKQQIPEHRRTRTLGASEYRPN